MKVVSRLKTINRTRDPSTSSPIFISLFHSTPAVFAKWKSKWDDTKDEGSNQQPSKPYVRYVVREKRADAKRALRNLLDGRPPNYHVRDEKLSWCGEEISSRRKDGSHSCPKNYKRPKGNCGSGRRWNKYKSFYDEDDFEEPVLSFSATFAGHKCYTWSFGSWENGNFQHSSTSGFEWREPKGEKAKERVWSESDLEDQDNSSYCSGLLSHRIALGLPPTGALKLDDIKCAFHAAALKWHPDKHQGSSKAIAGERFKLVVDAYKSLCSAIKSN